MKTFTAGAVLLVALLAAVLALAWPSEVTPAETEVFSAVLPPVPIKVDPEQTVYQIEAFSEKGAKAGSGSAVYIGNNLFLTADHVVADEKMQYKLPAVPGDVTVLWKAKDHDIALLRVAKMWPDKPAAKLACGTEQKIGDSAHAIGFPLGEPFTFQSFGKVGSSINPVNNYWKEMRLTDAAVIFGMSGGGMFNEAGELSGILVGLRVVPMGMGASITGLSVFVPVSTVCGLLAR